MDKESYYAPAGLVLKDEIAKIEKAKSLLRKIGNPMKIYLEEKNIAKELKLSQLEKKPVAEKKIEPKPAVEKKVEPKAVEKPKPVVEKKAEPKPAPRPKGKSKIVVLIPIGIPGMGKTELIEDQLKPTIDRQFPNA